MKQNNSCSAKKAHFTASRFAFITLIVMVMAFTSSCNFPFSQEDTGSQDSSDKNARMYQMHYDSSTDPAQDVLQVRRFVGQLHMIDLGAIFGDIQSLPLDDNCNYSGGPVFKDGLIWYVTVTPDLIGVNLVSLSPDGTMSSAFDLDGDRIVDILDIRLPDNRRFSILNELNGLQAFKDFLSGMDPFCSTDLIRQLNLPDLGCDGAGNGSSGVGGFAPGGNFFDPMGVICSQYNTGPNRFRNVWTKGQVAGGLPQVHRTGQEEVGEAGVTETSVDQVWDGRMQRWVRVTTTTFYDETDRDNPDPYEIQILVEYINPDTGDIQKSVTVLVKDPSSGEWEMQEKGDSNVQEGDGDKPDPNAGSDVTTQGRPGPEGDDPAIAALCQNRANNRSGVEQAADQDPSSMSISCNNPLSDPDMPPDPNCTIIAWASPGDFQDAVEPSTDGCDPFQTDDTHQCVDDPIARFRGYTAELRSINAPEMNICPQTVCDPGATVENIIPISIDKEALCPAAAEIPTLEPSEENCPPGTYYAPVTNRCIEIQVPSGGKGNGDGACKLSVSACSAKGLSFDSNKCRCVPIQ